MDEFNAKRVKIAKSAKGKGRGMGWEAARSV